MSRSPSNSAERPAATGSPRGRIEAGLYTLQVTATLSPDIAPGTSTTIAGQLQLAETKSSGLAKPNTLIAVAGIGVVGVIVVALATRLGGRQRRRATP